MGVIVQSYKDIALTRRKDQVRSVLDALETMGGRLLSIEDELEYRAGVMAS